MNRRTLAAALALAFPVSSLVVACGSDQDSTGNRQALEREALERDLDLALKADSGVQPQLTDVPVVAESPLDEPAPAPTPPPAEPRRQAPTVVRREAPRRAEPRPAEPAAPRYVTRTAPAGSTFSVSINEQLSAKNDGVGSTFTATLSEPLVTSGGSTVIPAGATVRGSITSVDNGRIGITFTSIRSGGETYPIDASVVSSPVSRRVNNTTTAENVGKVAAGGAIGAIAGRVIGRDRKATAIGTAVGAAAGGAAAAATQNRDTVIDAGSSATIRLDSSVSVRREQ
jgi:hypothetical protein